VKDIKLVVAVRNIDAWYYGTSEHRELRNAVDAASVSGETTYLQNSAGARVAKVAPVEDDPAAIRETERERILRRLTTCRTCGKWHEPGAAYGHPNMAPWVPAGQYPMDVRAFLRQLLGEGDLP
jgi:hypothetical protein